VAGSVPVLHPEAQAVDEILAGWRNQQMCGDLDHGMIAGRCWICSPRSTVPRQRSNELACPCELSNSPCLYLTAESDSAGFTSNPDGSNVRTIRQIRQVRIWRVTGKSRLFSLSYCSSTYLETSVEMPDQFGAVSAIPSALQLKGAFRCGRRGLQSIR